MNIRSLYAKGMTWGQIALSVLLYQRGGHDAALRRASVPVVIDSIIVAAAALAWTQFAWVIVVLYTSARWSIAIAALEVILFAIRVFLRRRLETKVWADGTIWMVLATNLAIISCVAIQVAILTASPKLDVMVLGMIISFGGMAYVSSIAAAFPIFAAVGLSIHGAGLTTGFASAAYEDLHLMAICVPFVAAAYWLLTWRLHDILVTSLRTEIAERHAARHDPVTGLSNRTGLADYLSAMAAGTLSGDGAEKAAILAIDLDGFKLVNDRYGHAVGDQMLIHVGKQLRSVTRPGDFVARIGGDEYVVVLPGADHTAARSVGERMIRAVQKPLRIGTEQTAQVGASVGVAVVEISEMSTSTAMSQADGALYEAKRAGKGCVRIHGDNVTNLDEIRQIA